ncbi:MAG TPA: hypothetical protein VMF90_10050 [Rhizobiaceae bacterium]|nr:hypothetical protein [Rhizobiaceae bacterium]
MYDTLIASLFLTAMFGRERPRRDRTQRAAPLELSMLSDHTLRDLGFRREPPGDQRRHLLRF